MEWMLMPYHRYADFQGRSGRMEYWMFQLFVVLVLTAAIILAVVAGVTGSASGGAVSPLFLIVGGLIVVFVLGSFIPSIAVQVRRFHDQDKSGWFILLGLIPYFGGLIMLIFMCLEGTRGPNRFGPDPRDPYNTDVFG